MEAIQHPLAMEVIRTEMLIFLKFLECFFPLFWARYGPRHGSRRNQRPIWDLFVQGLIFFIFLERV